MMSGSILFPPHDPKNDFSILFIETSGCLPMCGHGTIGTITIAIEEGLITPKIPGKIKMEAPAGLVNIEYGQTGKKVDWVKLVNVKSYLAAENLTIDCPELGEITFDVAYGGNYYAIVDPQKNFSGVHDFTASKIIQYSQVVRDRINEKYPEMFIHPEDDTIRDVTHLLWTGDPIDPTSSGRNAVFYGDKAIDRSPCGTGTSARLAQLYAKGKLKLGEKFIHESYIGSKFIGCVEEETTLAGNLAIVPSIQGWAKVFGYNTIIIDDEDDPYAHGFQVI
ncbi:MAG: 4-hydroxyproline epimerase, partial [Flavobacteriaceae bacterium]|nr:4-hydroxyproline epimerase [Flavobacteriaceae bacterium]